MPLTDKPAGPYAFILLRTYRGLRKSRCSIGKAGYSRRVSMSRERTARRRRTGHRLREIIRARTLCEFLRHAGFDVRIGGAGAKRRCQRERARHALCVLERGFRIWVVSASRRIVDSKDFEGRLIDQDLDGLRNDPGDGAHRIAHRRMFGDGQRRAEPAGS